ncbi:MAG TPA: D-glycero-beta-D-manno-heptose-7-phosphate kinase [Paenalcaligenes hominis]|uniref:D-glycero-beta-D-manno-heptose-7-phosphate kinase n=1 Tax=Paenalcaligenes hominis TaxID=643674 RepID=A0A9D2VHW3_9BURK|nr:D-glycero-beta-D-manno-heptose-7-phosphate kinase [Paenalcaligenes hominis]NJB63961.1 rfaE bifunctional protein kinase chain/domain [Paenalcaligenes hominis]GGE61974.1 sugar kinase [Paenalcaligenes hominis]HJH24744.1 D-glycero-beta-D-manno-heptose-7-phosphate kinase [Paenalcaligenes hominis]
MSPFPTKEHIAALKILVVGDVMVDRYWFGAVNRISPEAPVPIVKVTRKEDRLGGAANVARNCVALGAQASLIGFIGNDEAGTSIQQMCQAEHVEPYLCIDNDLPTILKLRILGRQQQLLRVDFEQAPSPAVLTQLETYFSDLVAQHHIVVLSDYAKGALNRVETLIQTAHKQGVPVLVDPKGDQYSRYTGAASITPNRLEMEQAVGKWASEDDLTARAQALRQRLNLEALLITRSEQGMTMYTAQGRAHAAAEAQEVFDVSGAGDTVLATLAVTRAAGLSWVDAMHWANKAGSIVVGKLGTSTVTAEELR